MHNPGTNVAVLSTPSQDLRGTRRAKWPVACLQATGLQCALGDVVPKICQARMVCEKSSIRAAFGGEQDVPAVVHTPPSCYWVIWRSQTWFSFSSSDNFQSFGHMEEPISAVAPNLLLVCSRSAPRTISRASPSVLEIKNCCNSWSISFVTLSSC